MATNDAMIGPINIGNPTEFSVLDLASIIIDVTGSRSHIVHRPLPEDDPRQRQPDISRAQEVLSWAPTTKLRDGLIRTIAYFENMLAEKHEGEFQIGDTLA